MMKRIISLVAATAVVAACSSPTDPVNQQAAPLPSFSQTTPGTPGEANCRGQTTAYLAQASKNGAEGIPEGFRGLGGVSRATGLSVQEIKAIVDAFCAAP